MLLCFPSRVSFSNNGLSWVSEVTMLHRSPVSMSIEDGGSNPLYAMDVIISIFSLVKAKTLSSLCVIRSFLFDGSGINCDPKDHR